MENFNVLFKRLSLPAVCFAVALIAVAGCNTIENNYLNPEDFASYLRRNGVEVTGEPRPLPGSPFGASSGCAIMVGNSEIGVYKFDQSVRPIAERLKQVKQSERLYINGIPYPVEVRGSFVIMGLEKNKKKHEILRVFDKFY